MVVPEPRFELGCPCGPRCLRPLRLPFRHSGAGESVAPSSPDDGRAARDPCGEERARRALSRTCNENGLFRILATTHRLAILATLGLVLYGPGRTE